MAGWPLGRVRLGAPNLVTKEKHIDAGPDRTLSQKRRMVTGQDRARGGELMTVCTDKSNDGLALLLRRTGATAGFLFGFGLLGGVMASNASADDRQPGGEDPTPGPVES